MTISVEKTQAREAARHGDGTFGEQHLPEPDLDGLHGYHANTDVPNSNGAGPGDTDADDERLIFGVDADELLALCELGARTATRRRDAFDAHTGGLIESDDVAQDLALRILEAEARGSQLTSVKGTVLRIASHVHGERGSVLNGTDRRAFTLLQTAETAFMQREGRMFTTEERRLAAQHILDNWHDPRHKPTDHFRHVVTTGDGSPHHAIQWSIATGRNREDAYLGRSSLEDRGHEVGSPVPGSWMDQALEATETQGRNKEARRLAWNARAEVGGFPLVRPRQLSQNKVTVHRQHIDSDTDVATAVAEYRAGEVTPRTEALFAPWPTATEQERAAIASALAGPMRGQAVEMWRSAVEFANNRRGDTSQAAWDAAHAG